MSFASNIADTSKQPVCLVEFEGDTLLALDATTGWSTADGGAALTTSTSGKEGAGSVSFDKAAGNTRATIVNSTLTAMTFATSTYRMLWVYLSALTDVASVRVRLGSDASNYDEWTVADTALVAGWNRLYLDHLQQGTGYTYAAGGTVDRTAVDYMQVSVLFDAAGNTLTGILIDNLTKHPWRYSTGYVTSAMCSTKVGWLVPPSIGPTSERVQEGRVNVASASCVVIDDGSATVIADLTNFAMPGRVTTIKMGFRSEVEDPAAETNWQPIHRGVLFAPQHIGRAWQFQISDLLEKFNRPVMQDALAASTVALSGNIVTCWLKLALSTGNGNNNATYDTLTAVRGAGISADLFDIATIESERDTWLPNDTASFTFAKPEADFLKWSFEQVFLAYGIVPVVLPSGKLSIKVVRPPYGAEQTNTLTVANIITPTPQFTQPLESVYNQVTVYHTYVVATDSYSDPVRQGDSASQAKYGVRDLPVYSKGITSSTVATRVAKRILARLGNGAPPIAGEALMSQQARKLGETVAITHAQVPDLVAGTYGITAKLAEVTVRGFNPANGCRVQFEVCLTSYLTGNYRFIGPAAMTGPYDSNTAAQNRNYGSISDASNFLGAANDATHVIGPG